MHLNVFLNGSLEIMNDAIFNTLQYKALLRRINREYLELDEIPQYLGPNWETVLNWWFYYEQTFAYKILYDKIHESYHPYSETLSNIKRNISDACEIVVGNPNTHDVFMVAHYPEYFTLELIAMHEILDSGG